MDRFARGQFQVSYEAAHRLAIPARRSASNARSSSAKKPNSTRSCFGKTKMSATSPICARN